jgi:sirohydrochlorin ferrochelatase
LKRQLRRAMAALDMPDPTTTGVVLLGRGSSDRGANGDMAKMARWLRGGRPRAGRPGLHRHHLSAPGAGGAAPGASA